MAYPKWKHRKHPEHGFQSTLVANPAADAEVTSQGFVDDPKTADPTVVPYPAELTLGGTVMHHKGVTGAADANGNYAHGPAPTTPGLLGGAASQRVD